jgi:hypothetical protein
MGSSDSDFAMAKSSTRETELLCTVGLIPHLTDAQSIWISDPASHAIRTINENLRMAVSRVAMIPVQDDRGRDLKATLPGDGFTWELWADLNQSKDSAVAVVRKRFPNSVSRVVSEIELKVPAVLVDYQKLLQRVVDQLTKK